MGWAVGWDFDHGRHRGYGVPAWCDAYAKGCRTKIDRGMGYTCEASTCENPGEDDDDTRGCMDIDPIDKTLFVCGEHTCKDVDEAKLPPEHPEWVEHVATDDSWDQWRVENPVLLAAWQEAAS